MKEIAYITGCVHFRSRRDLAETSKILQEALGILLAPDEERIYEELPAYVGEALGLEVAVLGPPEDPALQAELSEVGVLQVRPSPRSYSSETIFKGVIDISTNLEELLRQTTDFEILPNRGPVVRLV